MEGIHIEICYSLSGGPKFAAAEKNAAEFIASLLQQYGWGVDKVTKHQDYDCLLYTSTRAKPVLRDQRARLENADRKENQAYRVQPDQLAPRGPKERQALKDCKV